MSVSEQVGRGDWEAARFRREYEGTTYSRFLCNIVVGDKNLVGIFSVNKYEEQNRGELSIPMEATASSSLADMVGKNAAQFADPNRNDAIAKELGLVFNGDYADLRVSALGGTRDRLGVTSSLTVSNSFSRQAPETTEPGDVGVVMGLAQHIMDSLPGWQITPEPVISR